MQRRKSSVNYMVHLDGIRAFAVGSVIVEHWASGFPHLLRKLVQSLDLGGLGVECFFVLSGFLITLILLDSKDRDQSFKTALGHFYIRRVLRIFPAYYAALLVTFFLFSDMRDVVGWHALYLSNLYPLRHGTFAPAGGHFWSLSVEEQFYIFWPLIVLALPTKRVMQVAIAGCVLAPLSRFIIWRMMEGPASVTVMTTALDLLCFGAFIACIKRYVGLSNDSIYNRYLKMAGLIGLLFYVVLFSLFRDTVLFIMFGRTLTTLFFGAAIVNAANGIKGKVGWVLGNRIIVWFGLISYGLYIFHPFIPKLYVLLLDLFGLGRETFGAYYIRYPLLFILLLLVTSTSYYFMERPVRGFRKYFS